MRPGTDRIVVLALFSFVSVWASVAVNAWPAETTGDPLAGPALEQIIERYLRTHPEVIEQSLQALENRRAAEEQQRQKAAIASHRPELLDDPASRSAETEPVTSPSWSFSTTAADTANGRPPR